jgi:spermidine synthase
MMRSGRATTVAFGLGATMMCMELVAVRLMAPHFGDSAHVWTNVIGVMLVALALGAWLGGRISGHGDAVRRLARALLGAAILSALVPLAVGPLGGWLVPQDLPLEAAMGALVRGSLVATILLFAPPVLLLGCASPILVAALVRNQVEVGRASASVSAAGTLGSLLGTFAATHVLVPGIGSRATVWVCAAAILLCTALLTRRAVAIAAIAPLLAAGLLRWPIRAPALGEVLAECESSHQFLQVVREPGEGGSVTSLKINEGLDSFHSLALSTTAWTNGAYYDWHTVAPILADDGAVPDGSALRVLSLGSAAGTFARLFAAAYPGCRVDGVELDPAVTALGDEHFGGRGAAGRDYTGLDARVFVERAPAAAYDVVLVDCYARQIYIPAHVASREFFLAVKRCLRPRGVVSVNSGGWSFDDPVVEALGATMRDVFGGTRAFAVPWSRNYLLLARRDAAIDLAVLPLARLRNPELRDVIGRMAEPSSWRELLAPAPILCDDRPLLDALQHHSFSAAHERNSTELTQAAGPRDPVDVGELARTDLVAGRASLCLAHLREARELTPYLRLLAGDARWALHDLPGARAEFQAALRGEVDAETRGLLVAREARAAAQLEVFERAAGVTSRNGWLAALGVLLAAVATLALLRARPPA